MDLISFITKIYEAHQKIKASQQVSPDFGMISERYETSAGPAILHVFLSSPTRRSKGKRKDYEKIIQKSIQQGKTVSSSKDFSMIQQYLGSVFSSIATPLPDILDKMQTLMAGLILGFVPIQNVKYSVKSNPRVGFVAYDTVTAGQYAFFFSIVGMKEDGLYLAHENQIAFLKQEIINGKNPTLIRNIPTIQSGSGSAPPKALPAKSGRAPNHQAIKKFRKQIQQKKDDVQIKKELEFETVIDFSSRQSADSPSNQFSPTITQVPPPLSSKSVDVNNISRPAPLPHPSVLPTPVPKILPDSFSGLKKQPSPPINAQPLGQKGTHPQLIPTVDTTSSEKLETENEINQLKTQISLITDNLTKQLAEKDKEIIEYEDDIEKLEDDLEKSLTAHKEVSQANLTLQAKYDKFLQEIESKVSLLKNENNELVRTIQKIDRKNKELTQELQNADQKYHQIMSEKLNLEIIITELQEESDEIRRDFDKMQEK